MRVPNAIATGLALAALSPLSARAQEPEQPIQELFIGETAYVQGEGELQASVFVDGVHAREQPLGQVALMLEYGFTDWLQLGATLPAVWQAGDGVAGLGRPSLELLVGGNEPSPEVLWAAGVEVRFPRITDALDEVEDAYTLRPHVRLHVGLLPLRLVWRVGADLEQPLASAQRSKRVFSSSLGAFVPLGPVVPTVEVRVEAGDEERITGALGVVWPALDWLEIGAAALGGAGPEGPFVGGRMLFIAQHGFLDES